MNTIAILTKARELLADPEHWTRGAYAKDKWGNACATYEPDATQFCSIGAVMWAARHGNVKCFNDARDQLRATLDFDIAQWNDDPMTTHANVLEAFDAAIAL